MKIKCIIVDDEPLAREGILDYSAKISFLEVLGEFENARGAEEFLSEHPVDLVFLDINMPGKSGLDLIRGMDQAPAIIFTTAYREFAADSYDLNGLDYLVKPISFERFYKACDKALNMFTAEDRTESDHFFVKVDGVITKVMHNDLLYAEGMKDYVKLYIKNKPRLIALLSLKQLEQELPKQFIRVHRSFLISSSKVDSIDGNQIKIGEAEIPIAPMLRAEVLEKIMGGKYLKR